MTLINAEKFVERIQDCGTDETKQKVADALCFLVKTEAEFHPVEAIPIEWMKQKYPAAVNHDTTRYISKVDLLNEIIEEWRKEE